MRNIFIALITLFIAASSVIEAQTLLVDNGSSNNYVLTYPANLGTGIPQGMMFTFKAINANTGTSTLNINGLGGITIKKNFNVDLTANDIKANHFVTVIYDGTNWQMLSSVANASSSQWNNNASDIYFSTGKVGIGNTSPTTALAVNGAITVDNGNTNDGASGTFPTSALRLGNTNSIGISSQKTVGTNQNGIDFWTSGSVRMLINNGGNIGVGGSFTPNALLHQNVFANAATYHKFTNNNTLSSSTDGTDIGIDISGNTEIRNYENNAINFFTNNTQRMSITNTGAVQINNLGAGFVTSDASGILGFNANTFLPNAAASGSVPYVFSGTLQTSPIKTDGSYVTIGNTVQSNYLFRVDQTSTTFPAIYGQNSFTAGTAIWGYSNNVTAGSIGVKGVSVGGGTGIYGDNSGAGYGVYGNNNSTGYAGYFNQSGSGYAAAFMGGNVGIGTFTPSTNLHVVGNAKITGLVGPGYVQADVSGNLSIGSSSLLSGAGTASYVPYYTGTYTLSATNKFQYDGTAIAVGGITPTSSYIFQAQQNSSVFPAIYGVNNFAGAGTGVYGYSTGAAASAAGVFGSHNGIGAGIYGYNNSSGYGVFGLNNSTGYAGYFNQSGSGYAAAFMGGNVGIGTATPGSRLDVQVSGSGPATAASISTTYSTANGTGLYVSANSGLTASVSATAISANASGAGTTGTTGYGISANSQNNATNYGVYGQAIGSSGTNNYGVYASSNVTAASSNNYGIYTQATGSGTNNYGIYSQVSGTATNKYAAVFMGGNVGIGTATPQVDFDIVDNSGYGEIDINTFGATSYSALILARGRGTSAAITAVQTNDVLGSIQFRGSYTGTIQGSAAPSIRSDAEENWTSAANGSNLVFNTIAPLTNVVSERMRITGAGNIGIGTFAPNAKLEVSSPNQTNVNPTTATLSLFANTTQNTDVGAILGFNGWSSGTSSAAVFGAIRGAKENATAANSAGYLAFYTNTNSFNISERMRINSSGFIGIGTSSPQSRLDINGGVAIGSYAGVTAAPSNGLIVSGNVGIGTSSTSSALLNIGQTGTTGTIALTATNGSSLILTPNAATAGWTMTLPNGAGISGQALITNGSGVTNWGIAASGIASLTAASASISNTETSIISASLPANSMIVCSTYRIKTYGTCSPTSAGTTNVRIRLGTAGTLADAQMITIPTTGAIGTTIPFTAQYMFTIRTTGVAGIGIFSGELFNGGTTGISTSTVVIATPATGTINTTVANTVQLTFQSSISTLPCIFTNATVEIVK